MRIWAVVPAAGVGLRYRSTIPKQYLPLCGIPIILHSINRLLKIKEIKEVFVVLSPEDTFWQKLDYSHPKLKTTLGGCRRSESVSNALNDLSAKADEEDWVLVHDAVRPCVSQSDIQKLIEAIRNEDIGGLLAYPLSDTIKEVDDGLSVRKTIARENLWSAMTPQLFRYGLLRKAYTEAILTGLSITDEASAIELLGLRPKIIQGKKTNIKMTHAEDMALAESIISAWVDN